MDSFVTKEEFVGAKKVRGLISDEADYDKIIDLYEQQKGDKPFVMFNVTMQNHNPYTKKSSFKEPIKVTSFQADPEVEQYLSLIHESDAALQKLIAYYEKQPEQAVIVFFGDHQPHLPDSFYFQMTGKIPAGFTKEEALKKYEVPFLIWANYDITEKEIDHISLNYLSTEMAVDTGQSMSAYQCFLQAMQQEISSLSDNGCYDAEGRYYTDVYKRQNLHSQSPHSGHETTIVKLIAGFFADRVYKFCLLYTSIEETADWRSLL